MTLRIDKDVAKFFRATGEGFQVKMNDVLRAFMMAAQLRVPEGDVEKIGKRKAGLVRAARPAAPK